MTIYILVIEWSRQKSLRISRTILQQYEKQTRDVALRYLKQKSLTIRQLERLTGINRGMI